MGLVKRRSPAARVQRKDGQACLLMPWDTVFSEESGGGEGAERKKQEGSEKKNPLKESGGHMSPLLLSILVLQDLKLNIDAENEDEVEQGLNGGEKMSVSLTPACSPSSKGKDDDPDLQSQAPLS